MIYIYILSIYYNIYILSIYISDMKCYVKQKIFKNLFYQCITLITFNRLSFYYLIISISIPYQSIPITLFIIKILIFFLKFK